MAATFEDAGKGYEFFLKNRGKISLREINSRLTRAGNREVSPRMYDHYTKLLNNGFRYYIPINHLDVFLSIGDFHIITEKRRFRREESFGDVEFSFDREKWFKGEIVDVSAVGFGIKATTTLTVDDFSPAWIKISNHEDIPAVLVWKSGKGKETKLGFRAKDYISNYVLQKGDERKRSLGKFLLTRTEEGEIDWEKFTFFFAAINEFMLGLEALIYSASEQTESKVILRRPILESIEFHSPGDAPVKVDLGVAEIADTIISKVLYWRLDRRKRILEVDNMEVDLLKKTFDLAKELGDEAIDDITDAVKEKLRKVAGLRRVPDTFLSKGTTEHASLIKRILPDALRLIDEHQKEFKLKVDKNPNRRG